MHGSTDMGVNLTVHAGVSFRLHLSGIGMNSGTSTGSSYAQAKLLTPVYGSDCTRTGASTAHVSGVAEGVRPSFASLFYNAWENVRIDTCQSFKLCHCAFDCHVGANWYDAGVVTSVNPPAQVIPDQGFLKPFPLCPSDADVFGPYSLRTTMNTAEILQEKDEDKAERGMIRLKFLVGSNMPSWSDTMITADDSKWKLAFAKLVRAKVRSYSKLLDGWLPLEEDVEVGVVDYETPFWRRKLPSEKLKLYDIDFELGQKALNEDDKKTRNLKESSTFFEAAKNFFSFRVTRKVEKVSESLRVSSEVSDYQEGEEVPGLKDSESGLNPFSTFRFWASLPTRFLQASCTDDDSAFFAIMGAPLTSCAWAAEYFGLAAICTGGGGSLPSARSVGCRGTCADYICRVTSTTTTTQASNPLTLPLVTAFKPVYVFVLTKSMKSREMIQQNIATEFVGQGKQRGLQASLFHYAGEAGVVNFPGNYPFT